MLKESNSYSTPFELVCVICNFVISSSILINNGTLYCSKCNNNCPFVYKHCIYATIESITKNIVHCTIRETLVHDLLPRLKPMSYEQYFQEKETIVYMLCDLRIHSKFLLNEDSELLHVDSQMKGTLTS